MQCGNIRRDRTLPVMPFCLRAYDRGGKYVPGCPGEAAEDDIAVKDLSVCGDCGRSISDRSEPLWRV